MRALAKCFPTASGSFWKHLQASVGLWALWVRNTSGMFQCGDLCIDLRSQDPFRIFFFFCNDDEKSLWMTVMNRIPVPQIPCWEIIGANWTHICTWNHVTSTATFLEVCYTVLPTWLGPDDGYFCVFIFWSRTEIQGVSWRLCLPQILFFPQQFLNILIVRH